MIVQRGFIFGSGINNSAQQDRQNTRIERNRIGAMKLWEWNDLNFDLVNKKSSVLVRKWETFRRSHLISITLATTSTLEYLQSTQNTFNLAHSFHTLIYTVQRTHTVWRTYRKSSAETRLVQFCRIQSEIGIFAFSIKLECTPDSKAFLPQIKEKNRVRRKKTIHEATFFSILTPFLHRCMSLRPNN